MITATADRLRAAGHTVILAINGGHRPTAEVEEDRAERRQDRADGLAVKADQHTAAAHAAHERARQLADQIPFGQPILIGHHSEGRMRRHAERIHAAMDATVNAATLAEETRRRAEVAATSTSAAYHPVTVTNRIRTLTAEQGKITRSLNGHTRTITVTPDGTRHVETTRPAAGAYRDKLTDRLTVVTDQLTYWQGIRDQQITDGTATGYSPASITKGDTVRIRGRWHEVIRVNKKTVTVRSTLGSWTDTAPYHEITDHHPAGTTETIGNHRRVNNSHPQGDGLATRSAPAEGWTRPRGAACGRAAGPCPNSGNRRRSAARRKVGRIAVQHGAPGPGQ